VRDFEAWIASIRLIQAAEHNLKRKEEYMKSMKRVIITAVVFCLAIVLPQLVEAQGSKAGNVVTFGSSVPLTGWATYEGRIVEQGYKLWQEEINKIGGLKVGTARYKVNLIVYDDKSDAQTAAKLTEKLITEDKVDFLLSPFSSTLTVATSAIAEKYKKINLAPVANAEKLYERGYKYLFGLLPPAVANVGTLLQMAKDYKFDIKSVAVVTPDDMYPLAAAEGARATAKELGFQVVDFIKYPKDASDLSTVASRLRELKPDAIIGTPYLEGSLLLAQNLYVQKVKTKMLGMPDVAAMPQFVANLGKAAEQVVSSTWWTKDIGWKDSLFGNTAHFAKLWKDKYGIEPPSGWPAAAAVGAEVLQIAIEKAGTLETEKVRETLLSLNVETVFMPVRFGKIGTLEQINVAGKAIPLQVQNGKVLIVYPERFRQAKPIFPMSTWQ
jgi:branched-chain amino acid transport system substrate-binding protein